MILSRIEGLTVYLLHEQIKENEIPLHFQYRHIQDAIKKISTIEPGNNPHTEKILRTLLHYFIERPANSKYDYTLSDYAVKFVGLIENKLNNPLSKYPLRETFKKYSNFEPETIKSINDFSEWYDLKFHQASQQTVLDHLESLKDDVNTNIKKLNEVLAKDFESASVLADEFSAIFKSIGKRSDEIKDTMKLGGSLDSKMRQVVEMFKSRLENYKHPENQAEKEKFEILDFEYKEAINIRDKVSNFFQLVDDKLQQLIDKFIFASAQLNHLQDNFRNQSRFRLNVKRFLRFTLNEANYDKEGPKLPGYFPRKILPKESFRFRWVRYKDSFSKPINKIIPLQIDTMYQRKETIKINKEIEQQQNTAKLTRYYKDLLKRNKELDFTEHFYKILKEEKDTEIALNVGYEIFEYANGLSEYSIEIKKELPENYEQKNITVWKMKITSAQ